MLIQLTDPRGNGEDLNDAYRAMIDAALSRSEGDVG